MESRCHDKIVIGVGGRFHADRMAETFLKQGRRIELFTSLPRSRFPSLPPSMVHPILSPELVFRMARLVRQENFGDLWKMRLFGSALSRRLQSAKARPDLLVAWSSFALESFKVLSSPFKVLCRDSAHVLFQDEILKKEYKNLQLPFPDRTICIQRELAEYELADIILVCSPMAESTFLEKGIPPQKLRVLCPGTDVALFHPERVYRPKLPLKVVYFGQLSIRKGVHYLLEATKNFPQSHLQLDCIGGPSEEFIPFLSKYRHAQYKGYLAHKDLAHSLRHYDIFVFPTLEDGFGMTLPQAMASGLVPIVSRNCGASFLIEDGSNGVLISAANSQAIRLALDVFVANPAALVPMREQAIRTAQKCSWENYERVLSQIVNNIPTAGVVIP